MSIGDPTMHVLSISAFSQSRQCLAISVYGRRSDPEPVLVITSGDRETLIHTST